MVVRIDAAGALWLCAYRSKETHAFGDFFAAWARWQRLLQQWKMVDFKGGSSSSRSNNNNNNNNNNSGSSSRSRSSSSRSRSSNNSGVELNTQSSRDNDGGALGLDLTSGETNGSAAVGGEKAGKAVLALSRFPLCIVLSRKADCVCQLAQLI